MSITLLEIDSDWGRCERCREMVRSRVRRDGKLKCRECADAYGCECDDPGCIAHYYETKCDQIAIGTLSDGGDNELNYCAECAASTLESLEFADVVWEKHFDDEGGDDMKTDPADFRLGLMDFVGPLSATCINDCTGPGANDRMVKFWQRKLVFCAPREFSIPFLLETGGWSREDLEATDDTTLSQRVLWVVCHNRKQEGGKQ